ncbi:iron complex outermembrane recepter protein [Methylophilus rhizosphaerae]|uniref:Iron complex outermembrane recepter protein n=1 Tax=Methylophilus rhizosphaerae TaxID=492660 RepID=A0A1G9D0B3_9PROT|nr:TonB-dependent siderophore receptor [Methylophilus rhizosphaerae]SDK57360.1 iron complex outermembrane recepter protein [Methylophilus rhizosphaerae]
MTFINKNKQSGTYLLPKRSVVAVLLAFAASPVLAADAEAEQKGTVTLDEVAVVGSADKSGDNFKSSAQSVSIINEQDIRSIGANKKLDDLLGYEAGVLSKQFGADNKSNWFQVRGFDANTTLDGTSISNNGFFVWEQEIYGLEKVEVLKGANSFNYGATDAGGTINLVSKRPMTDVAGELNVSVGNFDRRTVSGDYNGIINDSVRYRLVGLYSKGDFPIHYTGMEQFYFAPSLTWDITDHTSLTVLASMLKKKGTPTNGFMPAYGSLTGTPYGKIGYHTNLGEPDRDYFDRKQYSLGYEFSHDFGQQFKFTQNYRYGKMDHDFVGVFAWGSDNDRLAHRGYSYLNGNSTVHSIDNRLSKTFAFGEFIDTFMVGLDYKRSKADAKNNGFGFVPDIDMFNPVYGAPFTVTGNPYDLSLKQQGTYIFNKLDWNDTVLVNLGLRHDRYDNSSYIGLVRNADDGDKNTHNVSIMVRTPLGLSPYVSHSTSFNPQLGSDGYGRGYKPFEGKQWEVGMKYEPTWMKASFNLALFDLTEKNALIADASNIQIQAGERRNRGIELQSDWLLSDSVSARVSYTRNNAEQDLSVTQTVRAPLIPDNQAAVKISYKRLQSDILNGLKLTFGIRYNGSTEDQRYYPGQKVPSYTLVDAMASYPVSQHWNLQVNATNLFNKEYLSACDFYCYYGTSRTVDAQLSYLW